MSAQTQTVVHVFTFTGTPDEADDWIRRAVRRAQRLPGYADARAYVYGDMKTPLIDVPGLTQDQADALAGMDLRTVADAVAHFKDQNTCIYGTMEIVPGLSNREFRGLVANWVNHYGPPIERHIGCIEQEHAMSVLLYNALCRNGLDTLRKVSGQTETQITDIRGLGGKSLKELKAILAFYGLALRQA